MSEPNSTNVSQLLVECLEAEGVEYVFGIPGEENLHLMDALGESNIRFITTRHEQGASFMADIYGKLTGKPGVCLSTLGPGAINLALGTADAQLDSHPLVALVAQAGLNRSYKESHQMMDLAAFFQPISKWVGTVTEPAATAEIIRTAFKVAQSGRPGATAVIVPEDVSALPSIGRPLMRNLPQDTAPSNAQIDRAVALIEQAKRPVVLAGPGVARDHAGPALQRFAEALDLPVATTFAGKGVMPQDHANALGTLGFMKHDYSNFGFDAADLVITVGYDLIEYAPERWNPDNDKTILHIHRIPAEVDANYQLAVGIQGGIDSTLDALTARQPRCAPADHGLIQRLRQLFAAELDNGAKDNSYPLKPQTRVSGKNSADIRMVVDAIDLCYAKEHIDTFVLVSGDSDFSPLVSKLKENDKRVIGCGVKSSTSDLLVANCDEFIYYDDLVRKSGNQRKRKKATNKDDKAAEVRDKLVEIVASLESDYDPVWGSLVKQTIKRVYPGFDESYYGFKSFSDLLKDAQKHKQITLDYDGDRGNYKVSVE